jgi:trehalose-6-phosphatase
MADVLEIGKPKTHSNGYFPAKSIAEVHEFYLTGEITTADDYIEWFDAIRHAKVNTIQITATEESTEFILCVHYRATDNANKWISSNAKAGLGTLIVQDRLQIVGAKMIVEVKDNVVTHTVIIDK